MEKFNNYLEITGIKEPCLEFLKAKLKEEYSFDLVRDIFSLPCMKYETKHKLVLILILLEDGKVNDTIIDWLTQLLYNISGELWDEYKGRLRAYIEEKYHQLSRNQMMLLANTIEIMYTKGYDALKLLELIYQRIPLSNVEFDPDSADNVRVKLAKVAYSTNQYNFNEKFAVVQALKYHLKTSGRKYLLGMLNYYKGLCLKMAGVSIDYKDASYYILKSKNLGFGLADIYFSYMLINFENSKTS